MRPREEDLLKLLQEVEAQEDLADALAAPAEPERDLEACPHCGEPAEALDDCGYCGEPGCLPPELWSPGMRDNCLTRCVRCARHLHLTCGVEEQSGNLACPRCPF